MKRQMLRLGLCLILIMSISVSFVTPVIARSSGVLDGKVIILDAGHGIDTTNYYQGYCEHTAMLSLALKIKPILEERGATVHLTRPSGEGVLLSTRIAMSNIWSLEAIKKSKVRSTDDEVMLIKELHEIDRLINIMQSVIDDPDDFAPIYFNTPFSPDVTIHPDLERIFELQSDPVIGQNFLFISLHSNATGRPVNTAVHGADVFYAGNNHSGLSHYYSNYSYVRQNVYFGNIILDHIQKTGIQKRKVSSANFFVVREHNIPAVLVENGHHTNTQDRANLMNDYFLERLAFAYLDAITAYFADLPLSPIFFRPFSFDYFAPHWSKPNPIRW